DVADEDLAVRRLGDRRLGHLEVTVLREADRSSGEPNLAAGFVHGHRAPILSAGTPRDQHPGPLDSGYLPKCPQTTSSSCGNGSRPRQAATWRGCWRSRRPRSSTCRSWRSSRVVSIAGRRVSDGGSLADWAK